MPPGCAVKPYQPGFVFFYTAIVIAVNLNLRSSDQYIRRNSACFRAFVRECGPFEGVTHADA
jgi:hypothetical protein